MLTSVGTGGARPYRLPVPLGTAFAWSNGATFVKTPIYFETPAAAERAAILILHHKPPKEDPPLHHHHSSSSPSPSHLIAIAIACNWDLLAIGDLVRIFGIDLSNSTMFSFIDLVIMSE